MNTEDFLTWYKEKEDADFRIEPKDVYERTWACRDFELSHLWQRSVFLAVFLLAIAGAYGTIILNMYFSDRNVTYQQQFIASGVCWLGISFSILWVMMAKGSKYWFEKYEAGIDYFEQSDYGENIKKVKDFPHHGNMPPLEKYMYDENIFSPKAGHYSVSKVNASIGIVSLIVFSFLEMFHFANFLHFRFINLTSLQYALFSIALWLFAGAVLFMILRYLCKSGETDE